MVLKKKNCMQELFFKTIKQVKVITIVGIILLFFSCDSVFEEDISNDIIQTIIPKQNDTLKKNIVNFRWNMVEGVVDYQLQIVKPDFNNIDEFIIDSLITELEIDLLLNPAKYQWRVRGLNNGYETIYSEPIDFVVDSISDLSNQNILLNFPENNKYLNSIATTFSWHKHFYATSYLYQFVDADSNNIIEQFTTNNDFYTPTEQSTNEGEYKWKVKGINDFSETVFAERIVFIDKTSPNIPSLTSPDDNFETTSLSITFDWDLGVDGGNTHAPISRTLEISTEDSFVTILFETKLVVDTFNYTFSNTGTFYWRVKAIDSADNESNYSTVRKIIIN